MLGVFAFPALLPHFLDLWDLSTIESIEATIEIIDVEMGKDAMYLTVGKTPLGRVHKLLSKLHSIRVSKDRGSLVSKEAEVLLNKFIQQL